MTIQRIILALGMIALFTQGALGHTYLSSVVINGKALSQPECVRPHPLGGFDSPIPLVSSPEMTCGWEPASKPANRKCPIAAGSTMSIQWHHTSNSSGDDIMDPSHKGPVIVYLARSDDGAGNVWFKIYEDGWTVSSNTWGTDRMIANGGRVTFTIPSDIAPGNYLLRGEVLALHGAYALNGVQPYVGCVELTITGSGSAKPAGVAFPGYYKNTDPGMFFNIYYNPGVTSYPIPGPAVYVPGSSSSGSAASSSASSAKPGSSSSSSSSTSAKSATTASATSSTPSPAASTTASSSSKSTATSSTPTPATSSATSGAASNSLKVQMNGGSSSWWLGVVVSGGSEATSKVEIMDSGAVSSWTVLVDQSYAFVFSQSKQLTLPVSVRLTSASGSQVVLSNVFTSWTMTSVINSGVNYGTSSSSGSSPTKKPSTSGSTASSSGSSGSSSVAVTLYPGADEWWFACTVSGVASVASVELKDAGTVSSYVLLTNNGYAFTLDTRGHAFVTPLSVRVTDEAGKVYTAVVSDFTANSVVSAL